MLYLILGGEVRIPNKTILERLDKLEESAKRQEAMTFIAIAVAYIILGVSIHTYNKVTGNVISYIVTALGLFVVFYTLHKAKIK